MPSVQLNMETFALLMDECSTRRRRRPLAPTSPPGPTPPTPRSSTSATHRTPLCRRPIQLHIVAADSPLLRRVVGPPCFPFGCAGSAVYIYLISHFDQIVCHCENGTSRVNTGDQFVVRFNSCPFICSNEHGTLCLADG